MFCANCGSNVENGVVFCPNCGKSVKGENIKIKQKSELMVNFVRKAFRNYLEVILWINLIVCTVSGWNTGNSIKEIVEFVMEEIMGKRNFSAAGYPFLGAILGIFIGLLLNIILGGLIATIINMDDKIEKINDDVKILKDIVINSDKK